MLDIDNQKISKSFAHTDVVVILLLGLCVLLLTAYLDLFETVLSFMQTHEKWELDEIFILSLYFSIALAFFSFRRWREAKNEIGKRIELEKQLIHAVHEAEHANQAKSEFLANMSHEIRTPLNSIIGFSDLLLEEIFGSLNEKQTRHVRNISSSGKHLLELINQILDIAKVESGQMKLNRETFRVADTLEEVKTVLYPLASKKNIKLTFTSDDGATEINADKLKLKQIIFNLASNAIKFTPENGRVDIGMMISDGMLTVMVADTGIGIKKSEQDDIFEPFKQAGQMSNKEYQGTGLGLSIVREFVELHKGRIWVESDPGIGSTFIFEIPVHSEE
ncbi:MAG: signal transduction histidine kinase [Methanolobus sp. T82-4]|jgi:signal transduction histidine kinase|nr:MAG: signal transduction histidine kinase [Methanolobus sp. T82-4]